MQEILTKIEALDVSVHVVRTKSKERYGQKPWMAFLKGERDGLTIETKALYGTTPEEALSAAWALFSPAEKLVEPTMLPTPVNSSDSIEDAVIARDENGDDIIF